MIEQILGAVRDVVKEDPNCSEIKKHHMFHGFTPSQEPSISISCARERYGDYDRDQDEVIATLTLSVNHSDMKPERGEAMVRALAKEVRFALYANPHLGGLVDEIHVNEANYVTDDLSQTGLLHVAEMEVEVKYYVERKRPTDTPTVAEIIASFGDEEVVLHEEEGGQA